MVRVSPVSVLVTLISACGTTDPAGSVITPAIPPVLPVCAIDTAAVTAKRRAAIANLRIEDSLSERDI